MINKDVENYLDTLHADYQRYLDADGPSAVVTFNLVIPHRILRVNKYVRCIKNYLRSEFEKLLEVDND